MNEVMTAHGREVVGQYRTATTARGRAEAAGIAGLWGGAAIAWAVMVRLNET